MVDFKLLLLLLEKEWEDEVRQFTEIYSNSIRVLFNIIYLLLLLPLFRDKFQRLSILNWNHYLVWHCRFIESHWKGLEFFQTVCRWGNKYTHICVYYCVRIKWIKLSNFKMKNWSYKFELHVKFFLLLLRAI